MRKLYFLFFTALPARAVRALPVTACDILVRSISLVTLVLWARLASFWEPPTPIRGWRCFLTLGERLSPPTPILSTPATRGAPLGVSTPLTYPIGTWVGAIYLWGIIRCLVHCAVILQGWDATHLIVAVMIFQKLDTGVQSEEIEARR